MSFEPRIPGLKRSLCLPNRPVASDVEDEIEFHVTSRMRDLMAQGCPAGDARRLAEAQFGDLRAARRELAVLDARRRRRQGITQFFDGLARDLQHTVRSLRRSPGFVLGAVATLGIGIAAVVAIFTVVDGVLLRPLPYRNPERLVGVWFDMPPVNLVHVQQSAATYFTYQSQARTIDGIGIYAEEAVNVTEPGSASPPRRVTSASLTARMLTVLGVPPVHGRFFTASEDRPGGAPVMLIGEGLWRAQFGHDPAIIGRRLDVDGVAREIVGVMPSSFRFPSAETAIWIPLALDPVNPPLRRAFSYTGVARLRPGVSLADAQKEFAALLPRVIALYPNFVPGISTQQIMEQVKPVPVLTPLKVDVTGKVAGMLWLVTGAALLLLLVACANVANLSLVRFESHQQELAMRAALGAGLGRIMRYHFTESLLLAAAAGVIGVVAAWGAVRELATRGLAHLPRIAEVGLDGRAMLVACAASALAAVLCSLIPAIRMSGGLTLHTAVRGGTASRGQYRLRGGLVAAQVALGVIALAGSGLLLRSFARLHAVRLGFDPEHVTAFWTALPRAGYQTAEDVVRFYSRAVDRVAQLPGVNAVGVTSRVPLLARGMNENPLYPEDAPEYETRLPPLQSFTTVGGDYFRTMGIPLLAGKAFDRMDAQREGDAIVSSRTAELFWHDARGTGAVGRRFRALPTGPWYTVIGVVGNTYDTTLSAPPSATVYFPEVASRDYLTGQARRSMALVVRSAGDPSSLIPEVERAMRELDPTLPTFDVRPMAATVRASTERLAFTILVVGAAAAITLVLGAIGLYGVMAYVVTLRTRELGIRIALGASPRAVAAATARQGIALTGAGLAAGLVLFAVAVRFIRGFLFGVTSWDLLTLGSVALVLLATGACASWVPAQRAARIDPASALRAE